MSKETNGNGYQFTGDSVVKALGRRVPKSQVKNWLAELGLELDRDPETVYRWYLGKNKPDPDSEEGLFRFFGVEFANEVIHERYGWYVSEGPDALSRRIENAAKHTRLATDYLEGNVARLNVEGKVKA